MDPRRPVRRDHRRARPPASSGVSTTHGSTGRSPTPTSATRCRLSPIAWSDARRAVVAVAAGQHRQCGVRHRRVRRRRVPPRCRSDLWRDEIRPAVGVRPGATVRCRLRLGTRGPGGAVHVGPRSTVVEVESPEAGAVAAWAAPAPVAGPAVWLPSDPSCGRRRGPTSPASPSPAHDRRDRARRRLRRRRTWTSTTGG